MSLPCINLMPHRAWERARARRRLWQALTIWSAVAACLLLSAHWLLQSRVAAERELVAALQHAWSLAQVQAQQRRRAEQAWDQDAQARVQQQALWARQVDVVRWWSGVALALPPGAHLTRLQWAESEVTVVVRGRRDADAFVMQRALRLPAGRWGPFELVTLGGESGGAQGPPTLGRGPARQPDLDKPWVMRARAVGDEAP